MLNMQSDKVDELLTALAKAQGCALLSNEGSNNPFFKSKYSTLAELWNAARKPLSENGLSVIQTPLINDQGKIVLITTLGHTSGQWIKSALPVNPTKNDAQGVGSAITYMRRYALAAIVGLAPGDASDDDAEDDRKNADAQAKKLQVEASKPMKAGDLLDLQALGEVFPKGLEHLAKMYGGINKIPASDKNRAFAYMQNNIQKLHEVQDDTGV